MQTDLGEVRLKSGEPLRLAVIEPPAGHWTAPLTRLLAHKAPARQIEIAGELGGTLDDLRAAFYVGVVGEEAITVARVAGADGAGIWGHVYTVPAWRGRGAARLLHEAAMPDLRRRGYRVLTLGTNPRGVAQPLYASVGFHPVAPGSGSMAWGALADTPRGAPTVGAVRWGDWGWISAGACVALGEGERLPRSRVLGVARPGFVGGAFVDALLAGTPLLVLRRGPCAVGWASGSDPGDLYVRPDCAGDRAVLEAARGASAAAPPP